MMKRLATRLAQPLRADLAYAIAATVLLLGWAPRAGGQLHEDVQDVTLERARSHQNRLGGIEIRLRNAFIQQYAHRVSIDSDFLVDHALKQPHAPKDDADIHIAGRDSKIGLYTVAEIMNAAAEPPALKAVHAAEGTGQPVKVTGAWRIWCEHGGTGPQVQSDQELPPAPDTNPPHVFEIHPVTEFGGIDVTDSLKVIEGYQPKDAHDAFVTYEGLGCQIIPNDDGTTTIATTMAGYNYVEFEMKLLEDPRFADGGGTRVFASVHDLEGELLVHKRQMVIPKGSPAENAVRGMHAGQALQVLGLPRINLELVQWRVDEAAGKHQGRPANPGCLTWNLPYEIIIAATYGPVAVEE